MNQILVKKVKPIELSTDLIFRLNIIYKTELVDFITIADQKSNTLFVNEQIPDCEIESMVTIAGYEGEDLQDPDCEIAGIVDFIFEKYGGKAYFVLFDFYQYRMEEKEKIQAKKAAEELYQKILAYVQDESCTFWHMEYLLSYLIQLALNSKKKTSRNLIGFHEEVIFLLGFLMGNKTIEEPFEFL